MVSRGTGCSHCCIGWLSAYPCVLPAGGEDCRGRAAAGGEHPHQRPHLLRQGLHRGRAGALRAALLVLSAVVAEPATGSGLSTLKLVLWHTQASAAAAKQLSGRQRHCTAAAAKLHLYVLLPERSQPASHTQQQRYAGRACWRSCSGRRAAEAQAVHHCLQTRPAALGKRSALSSTWPCFSLRLKHI